MNILYIDHGGVISDSYMYQYYGDLFRELKELSNVYVCEGQVPDINMVLEKAPVTFDGIIFGLGYFAQSNLSNYQKIQGLAELDIPVVCMLHKPQNMLEQKINFCKLNKVDILLDYFQNKDPGIAKKVVRSWFTATPKNFHVRDLPVEYDVGFSGALHGKDKIQGPTQNLRTRVGEFLNKSEKYKVFWNSGNNLEYRIRSIEEYASQMNKCKAWLGTTGPVDDISPRYFEVALSKVLLICNDMPEVNGPVFVDGETCMTFKNDMSDFEEKLDFYLNNDEERNRVISNAYELVYNNYTWKHMASNLLNEIRSL